VSVAALLARGRAAALMLMTDTCYVRRAGAPTTNETTGVVTPSWSNVYASSGTPGACRVQEASGSDPGSEATAGENLTLLAGVVVSLPITATGIIPGDQVVIVAADFDTALPTRVFTVTRVLAKSHATARRLWCEEVQA
jgi:hypothetical protein